MHQRFLSISLGLAVALAALPSLALPTCRPSESLKPFDYPSAKVIPTHNDLLLPAGKSIPADGQQLTLRGRVLDRECKPVVEAVVELWQAGPFGRWQVANREDLATPRPVFAGAGRTYTDNEGYFTFVTAFPAPQRYVAPNLNIRIKPEGMAEYRSVLFFAGDERNDRDKTLSKLGKTTRDDISVNVTPGENESLAGEWTVVLPGKAPYQVY